MEDDEHINYADPEDLPDVLDSKTKAQLEAYLESKKQDEPNAPRSSGKVTSELCNLMNQMYSDGVNGTDIVDLVPVKSHNTVYYHLGDDCTHARRSRISYSECGWMRIHAENGAPSSTLAILNDICEEHATKHVTGRCSHEDGIKPVDGNVLRNNSRPEVTYTTKECPVCGDTFEYEDYRRRVTCSPSCNGKYASEKAQR